MDSFNQAFKGGEDNTELMSKLTSVLPGGMKGGAKKHHRRPTRKPRKVRSSKKRPAPTRKKPRRAKSSRRRSRRGGVWNTLPALALLAANEGMKRKSGSNLYARSRRWS